jgi:ABC-2 type transport system permease protein
MLTVFALARREWIRFWRERSRVAGFILAPLLFWFVVSSGFGDFERFFAGSLTLTILFASVFSNMSLIEDRREGFLKAVLVSPAPRWAIVAGKILGGASIAWLQAMIFLAFVHFTGWQTTLAGFLGAAWALALIAAGFTALGFTCAWRIHSTQGFHAILNLLLMPAWMISGALFPVSTAKTWLAWLMRLNPLAYALALMERLLNPSYAGFSMTASLAVTAITAVATVALAILVVHRPSHED